ncbi:MFS transporter [Methanobrevibacter sp. UBA46]|uniref:MFS transporter n=1 Tax=Methanobrevibacter sp. UBA46 TaxID=1915488 RepID=UPI0039B93CE5
MLAITILSYKINIIIPIIIFILGIFLLRFFVKRQLNIDVPFIKLDLFNNRLFRLSNIIIYIGFFAWMSGSVLIPLFLQSAIGVSAIITGYIILPATLVKAIFSPFGSGFYKKFGGHFTSILGSCLLIISCVPFIFFNVNVNLIYVILLYVIRMFGVILLLFPMLSYSLKEVDKSDYDQGMSIINSNRQIVAALGTTILLTFVSAISTHGDVSIEGINLAFFLQLILFVMALLISIFLLKPEKDQF